VSKPATLKLEMKNQNVMLRTLHLRTSRALLSFAGLLAALNTTVQATVITFNTNPFDGSTALVTPGRQTVGGEPFITFDIASDVFSIDPNFFGIGNAINFANDVVGNLPTGGRNVLVLQTFDNDGDPLTPFGAGAAADLIADRVTTPGPGFYVYFNSGLQLPRLVYSTDLSDNTADLKIMARLTNLGGQPGRDAIPTITAANFQIAAVPDAGNSFALLSAAGFGLFAVRSCLSRKTAQS
jgi:hypothetical protein